MLYFVVGTIMYSYNMVEQALVIVLVLTMYCKALIKTSVSELRPRKVELMHAHK